MQLDIRHFCVFPSFQPNWFIFVGLCSVSIGVCPTTVNTEEAAPSPGLPSIVTAVTQVTAAPPAITVSGPDSPTEWADIWEFRTHWAWGRHFGFIHSTCVSWWPCGIGAWIQATSSWSLWPAWNTNRQWNKCWRQRRETIGRQHTRGSY